MFSKTCEYALRALLHIALISTAKKKIGLKEIASRLNIPEHFLGKILQNLVRHKILLSSKGPNGGFYLDEKSKAMPLINVIEILDGTNTFHKCGLGLKQCSEKYPCPIHHEFKPYRTKLKKLLSQKSIQDLSSVIENGKAFLVNK